ncbi:MAG: tyrosine--tRNA ligase, partial [Victivallaceae bacterium]
RKARKARKARFVVFSWDGVMRSILSYLRSRKILEDVSGGLEGVTGPVSVYMGFDPTADSLHIGHLAGILLLKHFIRFGHKVVVLVGGATGMIGDPSGKTEERQLLSENSVRNNAEAIGKRLKELLGNDIEIVNNYDWFREIFWIDFLRDIGKHFRLGTLLSKDSVRARLESEEGISFTEFSYQLLQAYDFFYLSENRNVSLQLGGSDQWGNIVSGIEFVRRKQGKHVYGLTYPLLVNSDGKKLGKTESGAVWLNVDKTSPYDFYQYLCRLPDEGLSGVMRSLTFLKNEEIDELRKELAVDSERVRYLIVDSITKFVHGDRGLSSAKELTAKIAPGRIDEANEDVCRSLISAGSYRQVDLQEITTKKWIDVLVESGLCSSKSEARRLIDQKGIYVNGSALLTGDICVDISDFKEGKFIIVGCGKKKKLALCSEKACSKLVN